MTKKWIWFFPFSFGALIVWLSSRSALPLDVSLPHPWDKCAHGMGYAILAGLLEKAWRFSSHKTPLYRRHLWIFMGIALFGLSDEIHQAFVPGRSCDGWDWLADMVGASLGLAVTTLPLLWGRRLGAVSWWRGRKSRPEPQRPLIVVSDTHWRQETDLQWLQTIHAHHPGADWLFLGDLFEVWVGLSHLQEPMHHAFINWVKARRQEGRWMGCWLGNREFFLDSYASVFSLMGEGLGGELAAEGLYFEHGDWVVCDWGYRVWYLISRSGLMWLFGKALSFGIGSKVIRFLQTKMSSQNRIYQTPFPEHAVLRASAGRSTFLVGHFHHFQRIMGGVSLPFGQTGRYILWQSGHWNLYSNGSIVEGGHHEAK